jgi:hypothetical protein
MCLQAAELRKDDRPKSDALRVIRPNAESTGLYVQTKDVGGGRGTLAASDVADALTHAAAAVGDGAVAVLVEMRR